MKLGTRQDIDAPQDQVFAALTNFDHWERTALRRGVEVARTGGPETLAVGMAWMIGFDYRGKRRQLAVRLATLVPDDRLGFAGTSPSVEGTLQVDMVAMGPRRTRVAVSLEVAGTTLAARLFLQSLRLARRRVQERFDGRVAALAREIGDRLAPKKPLR
jgi:carbon monoxide dehydrogenase subunit G